MSSPVQPVARDEVVSDDAPVSSLPLNVHTLARARRGGYVYVGQLRNAPFRELVLCFGRTGIRQVVDVLERTGSGLRTMPLPHELWQAGFVTAEELDFPTRDDTPVDHLRPWLFAHVNAVLSGGIRTLGELRAASASGALLSIRGFGDLRVRRIRQVLEAHGEGTPPRE